MTDDTTWHAPGSEAVVPQATPRLPKSPQLPEMRQLPEPPEELQAPQPRYSVPGQFAAGQPAASQPAAGQPAQDESFFGQSTFDHPTQSSPGWVPPPRPGLIPLRPLDLGTLLGASFRVLRRNPLPTFGTAMLFQGGSTLLVLVVAGVVFASAMSRIPLASENDQQALVISSIIVAGLALLVPALVAFVANTFVQALIVVEVSRATLAEKLKFGQLWRIVRGRLPALIGWTAIAGAMVVVCITPVIAVVLGLATQGTSGAVGAFLVGSAGFLGVVVLLLWLFTKLSMVTNAIIIERLSIGRAIARSWTLTRSHFWRVFGITLLVATIVGFTTQVATIPMQFLVPLMAQFLDPAGQGAAASEVPLIIMGVIAVMLGVVIQAVTTVIQTSTNALLYLDLRMRREGLDLELTRFVEARHLSSHGQSGAVQPTDPYLVPRSRAMPPASPGATR